MVLISLLEHSHSLFFVAQARIDERLVRGIRKMLVRLRLEFFEEPKRLVALSRGSIRVSQYRDASCVSTGELIRFLKFRDGLLVRSFLCQRLAQLEVCNCKVRIESERLAALLYRLIVAARCEQNVSQASADNERKGIEALCLFHFVDGLVKPPEQAQLHCVPLMRCGIARVENKGLVVFLLRGIPVPLIVAQAKRQRGMRFAKRIV